MIHSASQIEGFVEHQVSLESRCALKILQVNTRDVAGGAEKVSLELRQIYEARGYDSWLAVGFKNSRRPGVFAVPNDRHRSRLARFWLTVAKALTPLSYRFQIAERLQYRIAWLGQRQRLKQIEAGYEDFDFPGTARMMDILPSRPDILHCHNLHGGYFDLSLLPEFSGQLPVFLTMHDTWLLAGHCAHSFGCERWKIGCGECPDLTIYPSVARDQTAFCWKRKNEIFAGSNIYLAVPCNWLMAQAQQSMLWQAVEEARVIPNGVNLEVYNPLGWPAAKIQIGLPDNAIVLLFVANGIKQNIWKDYQTLRKAIALIAEQLPGEEITFLALGEQADQEKIGSAMIRFIPYTQEATEVARYYRAADIYIHAARQDTFPNTILEALACGTPVVATAVGGIPEQIREGETGYLTTAGDAEHLAHAVIHLIRDQELRRNMGYHAAQHARNHFNIERQADEYLTWYLDVLSSDEWSSSQAISTFIKGDMGADYG